MWTVLPPPVSQRQTHRCYIQRALSPKEIQDQEKARKRKRQRRWGPPAKRGAAAGLQTLRANEDDLDPEGEDDEEETPPPLRVFFDIEAMQPQEQHVANLVVVESKTTLDPFASEENIAFELFSNG